MALNQEPIGDGGLQSKIKLDGRTVVVKGECQGELTSDFVSLRSLSLWVGVPPYTGGLAALAYFVTVLREMLSYLAIARSERPRFFASFKVLAPARRSSLTNRS